MYFSSGILITKEMEYDEALWFYHEGCEGRHFLLGNPHTVPGRIWAWCPATEQTIFVSLSDIGNRSPMAGYWLSGYLHGAQPDPPVDPEMGVDFQSAAYREWAQAAALFLKTGFWSDQLRFCERCGQKLLSAEMGATCVKCEEHGRADRS